MASLKQLIRGVIPRGIRNWLRSPKKTLLWAWGQTRYLWGLTELHEMRPGWQVVCHPLAYHHSYYAQQRDPEQVAEFDNFIAECGEGMVLFDIGAHFGLFGLAALHYGGPNARVVAVDASPTAAAMIKVQAQLNHLTDRLHVVHACVCDKPGSRDMIAVGVLADGYFTAPESGHSRRDVTPTPATTLDCLVEQYGLQPSHVKIDVEGFEGSVLRGARKLLSGNAPPVVFLELHSQLIRDHGEDPGEVLSLLQERSYTLFDAAGREASREAVLVKPLIRLVAKPSSHAAAPARVGVGAGFSHCEEGKR